MSRAKKPSAGRLLRIAFAGTCLSLFAVGFVAVAAATTIHVVTFYENDNGSDAVSTYQEGTASQDLTTFSSLSVPFSNSGYTFDDWNTEANGSGTSYADGATYSF